MLLQPGKPRVNSDNTSCRNELRYLFRISAVLSKTFQKLRLLFICPASWSNSFDLTDLLHKNSLFSQCFFVTSSTKRRILFGFAILYLMLIHFQLTDIFSHSSNSLSPTGYFGFFNYRVITRDLNTCVTILVNVGVLYLNLLHLCSVQLI